MKVKELIHKLNQLDQDLEVYCYEEGPVPIQGKNPGPFDIVDASLANVEMKRVSGKPSMSFGGSAATRKVAIIGITPDF
jgi:hypothetical protein